MLILILSIFGWIIGSGINYLADTLPWKRKLSAPFCTNCQSEIIWSNYFLYPRRCAQCGKHRDLGVVLVEIIFMILFPMMWFYPPVKLGFWFGILVLSYFSLVVVIDVRYKLILHSTSIPGAILGFIVGISIHDPGSTLLGGAVGYGVMFLLYMAGELFVRVMAKRRGQAVDDVALGFGDVNLSGIIGLMIGFPGVVISLYLAVLLGGAVSLVYILFLVISKKYQPNIAIPYGPFLVGGAVMVLFFLDILTKVFQS